MSERTRRALLAGLAAATTGLAGCADSGRPIGGGTDTPTRPSDATPSSAPDTLRLAATGGPVDEAVVYPERLRTWLRRAAADDVTVRAAALVSVPAPEPVMRRFESVTLDTGGGSVDGSYAVECEGGPRYEILVGAQSVESVPEHATVTPLSALAERLRELALSAIGGERTTVYPETRVGEWVRHAWFGGHFRHDGTVYRGVELQQTDAAFFSRELWMTLSLSPSAASSAGGPTLRFPDLDPDVRGFVDPMLADQEGTERELRRTVDELPEAVRAFAAETGHMLTHTTAFAVEAVDRRG